VLLTIGAAGALLITGAAGVLLVIGAPRLFVVAGEEPPPKLESGLPSGGSVGVTGSVAGAVEGGEEGPIKGAGRTSLTTPGTVTPPPLPVAGLGVVTVWGAEGTSCCWGAAAGAETAAGDATAGTAIVPPFCWRLNSWSVNVFSDSC
jgi:hypothetical protein